MRGDDFRIWQEVAFPAVCNFGNLTAINQLPEKLQAYFYLAEEKLFRSAGQAFITAHQYHFFSMWPPFLPHAPEQITIETVAEYLFHLTLAILVCVASVCFIVKNTENQPLSSIKMLCYFYALYTTLLCFWAIEMFANGSLSSNFIQTIISALSWDSYATDILVEISSNCHRLSSVTTHDADNDNIILEPWFPCTPGWLCKSDYDEEEQYFSTICKTPVAKYIVIIILLVCVLPVSGTLLEDLISAMKKLMQHFSFSKSKTPEQAFVRFAEQGYPSTTISALCP